MSHHGSGSVDLPWYCYVALAIILLASALYGYYMRCYRRRRDARIAADRNNQVLEGNGLPEGFSAGVPLIDESGAPAPPNYELGLSTHSSLVEGQEAKI